MLKHPLDPGSKPPQLYYENKAFFVETGNCNYRSRHEKLKVTTTFHTENLNEKS